MGSFGRFLKITIIRVSQDGFLSYERKFIYLKRVFMADKRMQSICRRREALEVYGKCGVPLCYKYIREVTIKRGKPGQKIRVTVSLILVQDNLNSHWQAISSLLFLGGSIKWFTSIWGLKQSTYALNIVTPTSLQKVFSLASPSFSSASNVGH